MMAQRTIGLIFGGVSSEHEVSIQSAARVAGGLARLNQTSVAPIYIEREGKWRWARPNEEMTPEELVLAVTDPRRLARNYQPGALEFAQALFHLTTDDCATNCIMLHGIGGEDGRMQGAFELAGVNYTGSGPAASALAMDKGRCQAFLRARGLPVPPFVTVDRCGGEARAAEVVEGEIGLPCIVKPSLGGSSVGVTAVRDRSELGGALRAAFEQGDAVHVERFISGREFTVGIVERDGPTALPVTEIIPPEGRLFDYDAKYTPGVTREIAPAEIDEGLTSRLQRIALDVHRAVGCEGFSRVDFMVGADGPMVLEINTIPGMTENSLLPRAAKAAGIEFHELLELILDSSLGRRRADRPTAGACER